MKGLKVIRSKWPINFISHTELSYFKSESSEPYKTLKPPQIFLPVRKSLHLPPRRHKHAERAEDKEGETCIVATEEVGELHVLQARHEPEGKESDGVVDKMEHHARRNAARAPIEPTKE